MTARVRGVDFCLKPNINYSIQHSGCVRISCAISTHLFNFPSAYLSVFCCDMLQIKSNKITSTRCSLLISVHIISISTSYGQDLHHLPVM